MRKIFITPRFFKLIGICIILLALTFFMPQAYFFMVVIVSILFLLLLIDFIFLHMARNAINGSRVIGEKISLGDFQDIHYSMQNRSAIDLNAELIDELPQQLQFRDAFPSMTFNKGNTVESSFNFRPTQRGEYLFGNLYVLISSRFLGLLQYKIRLCGEQLTKVYPSVIQMKKFAIQILSQTASNYGIRRVRMLGENDEFEHLRNYMQGDNIKSINWKATSRKAELVVNQFEDSKSQSVYCLVDKGRSMEMPFDGLSLLDYSINAALVISNIVLQKYDKAGLITFSNRIGSLIHADNKQSQLAAINEALYSQKTAFKESNFNLLYFTVRKRISRRSIIFLFTNFEHLHEVETNSAYIRALAQKHILITISFINTELENVIHSKCKTKSEIYHQTLAKSVYYQKYRIMNMIASYGSQVIITTPDKLNIDVINKYLEIKSKRMK